MARSRRELISDHLGQKTGTRAKCTTRKEVGLCWTGQALFSSSWTAACTVPFVCASWPPQDCDCPETIFPLCLPGASPGAWHMEGITEVELHFQKMHKRMVWGRRKGVHSVIRASKTLHSPSRQYPGAFSCLPRCISSEDTHLNFEYKTLL